jgi:hypothetical protein
MAERGNRTSPWKEKGDSMSQKTIGLLAFAAGLVVLIVSLAADSFGLGAVGGIGWKQWIGAGAGALLQVAGVWMLQKPSA